MLTDAGVWWDAADRGGSSGVGKGRGVYKEEVALSCLCSLLSLPMSLFLVSASLKGRGFHKEVPLPLLPLYVSAYYCCACVLMPLYMHTSAVYVCSCLYTCAEMALRLRAAAAAAA